MEKITYAFPKIKGIDPSVYIDAYNLLLECSNAHTPKDFSVTLIDMTAKVCPFDQALAFFFDRNGKLAGYHTVGTRKGWLETYLNYFIEYMDSDFNIAHISIRESAGETTDTLIHWSAVPDSEFKKDYIDVVHLKYSWAFTFFDMSGAPRVTICFDRCHEEPFSEMQQQTIRLALPILNNMFRNFYYKDQENMDTASLWKEYGLTKREKEIADMLCQGMKAARISHMLFITEATTHKHIAHIYRKANVSSQQELIARVLSKRALV